MYQIATDKNYTSTLPTMTAVNDWSEFVLFLVHMVEAQDATDRTKKYDTPTISPAIYASGARRANGNVLGWGAWCALDVDNDLVNVPAEDAIKEIEAAGLNYVLYGSTKSTEKVNRYRIVLPLSRHLAANEAQTVWKAVTHAFSWLGLDHSCKEISRIYGAPSTWIAHKDGNDDPFNIFEMKIDGVSIDVEDVLAAYVPPPEPDVKVVAYAPAKVTEDIYQNPRRMKILPVGHSLTHSPVVASHFIDDYLRLGKGEHHVGLYRFATRVIGRAKAKNYDISTNDVYQYCRELDALSLHKRDSERWKGLGREIERAFTFSGK